MSTVENFQNTALQLLALTASMFVNRLYGYLTCLKLIYWQILRNLPILLAFSKVRTVVSTVVTVLTTVLSLVVVFVWVILTLNVSCAL